MLVLLHFDYDISVHLFPLFAQNVPLTEKTFNPFFTQAIFVSNGQALHWIDANSTMFLT